MASVLRSSGILADFRSAVNMKRSPYTLPSDAVRPCLEYVREFLVPGIADRYGFLFGMVQLRRDGHPYESPGIVAVNADGAFARMGVRPGHMPFAFHGNGAATMYHALMAGERGRSAEFDVVNADDWSAGPDRQAFRTIRVEPRSTAR